MTAAEEAVLTEIFVSYCQIKNSKAHLMDSSQFQRLLTDLKITPSRQFDSIVPNGSPVKQGLAANGARSGELDTQKDVSKPQISRIDVDLAYTKATHLADLKQNEAALRKVDRGRRVRRQRALRRPSPASVVA